MNILILGANILTLLAFGLHTFVGDSELKVDEPTNETDTDFQKEKNGQWLDAVALIHNFRDPKVTLRLLAPLSICTQKS